MTATSTRSRVKKWPGYSCILLSRAICFCGCSVQNMACLEIETQLQSTTETETQFSISMQFANLQSQIVYASCKWSWLANVLHRLSRSQGAQDQIATDVSVDSHHHRPHWNKKQNRGGNICSSEVKSYWSPYSGFRIPVPDFKGSHNSCFLGVITSTRKSTCFLSHAISANKRTVYSKLLYREAEILQVLRILWWTRARLLWSVINFLQKYLASSKEDTSLSCIKPGVRFAWWNNSAVIWVILAFQRTTKLRFQKRFLI